MKTTLFFLVCFLCATAAAGQTAGVLSSQPVVLQIADHPQHASQHALAEEQSLLPGSAYSYAQGEKPLWECAVLPDPVPLGDVARAAKREHASAKKAQLVLEQ